MTKKLIIRLATAVVALFISQNAFSQFHLGGSLGFSYNSSSSPAFGVYVAPEIGYDFGRYFSMGSVLSYQSRGNVFGVEPYLRTRFGYIAERVCFSITASAPLRFADRYRSYGAIFRPGLYVRVAETVWLMAHIGDFGFRYTESNGSVSKGWLAKVDASTVSIGVSINL